MRRGYVSAVVATMLVSVLILGCRAKAGVTGSAVSMTGASGHPPGPENPCGVIGPCQGTQKDPLLKCPSAAAAACLARSSCKIISVATTEDDVINQKLRKESPALFGHLEPRITSQSLRE
jgi:hypothetical protein